MRASQASLHSLVAATAPGGALHAAQQHALRSLAVWERLFAPDAGARKRGRRAAADAPADADA